MSLPDYYTSETAASGRDKPADVPAPPRKLLTDAKLYVPDEPLAKAVNVALLLGQPLLLTGEPGTGKTQLAHSVAHALGFGEPLVFETKSTSVARDLFYTYDTIRRFQVAQARGQSDGGSAQDGEQTESKRRDQEKIDEKDFLTYNALGLAIIHANPVAKVSWALPHGFKRLDEPRRSVVLIDEIDKAPRDFPNDILNEVEHMYFRVQELGNRVVAAEDAMRPVLILTSNSEKHLPDAFLRRCVYHHIKFPDKDKLAEIVAKRVGGFTQESTFLTEAIDFFRQVRRIDGLNKKPATAELLGWMLYLSRCGVSPDERLVARANEVWGGLSLLVKNKEDLPAVRAKAEQILGTRPDPEEVEEDGED
jgi:MoxR-like ATPase